MGSCSSKTRMQHEQQARKEEVKKKRDNLAVLLKQGNSCPTHVNGHVKRIAPVFESS